MSQCAHNKAINLAAEGTVSVTDIPQTQNITIVGRPDFVNNNFKIALYAKETQRYLCFNDHWKLVGMKELQDTCYFNEAIVHGYFVFRSVVDLQRRIGFTQRGRAVGPKKTVNDACYMFTKIPTDQFFHQHTHFSVTKTKSTTKIPKTEYTNTPYSVHPGRGSGGGRPKQNRPKNSQHRLDETIPNKRKNKKQRNGNKQRQQKQDMQQIRGHSYNLSNPKNSTYLNSSRQNLELSQQQQHSSIDNHTKQQQQEEEPEEQHNHHHPPQSHQVRHHHNDPNKVARRQQHDQKQKTKLRQRARPSPSTTTTTTTAASASASTISTYLSTSKTIHSTKPQYASSTSYAEINPTSVVQQISTDASANRNTLSTVVVTKRKGRRRKAEKFHKKGMLKKVEQEPEQEYSTESTKQTTAQNWKQDAKSYTSSIGPATSSSYASYDDEEEYMTSSTDYAWINNNDIMLSSVRPTSASLPTWETWYPSSSTSSTEEDTDYSSSLGTSVTASTFTEIDADKRFATTLESSSMTDIDQNTLSLQTSLPLPTSVFTITTQNEIDETMSPTLTTDLGTTTTNTSTYTQTDSWSTTSLLDANDDDDVADLEAKNSVNRSIVATPKLDEAQGSTVAFENYFDDVNITETQHDSESSGSTITASVTDDDVSVSTSSTEASTEGRETTMDAVHVKTSSSDNIMSEVISSMADETTPTYSNDCANSTASNLNGSKTTTDCMYATKTAPIANIHKNSRHRNDSSNSDIPKRYFVQQNTETNLEMDSNPTTTSITLATTSATAKSNTVNTVPTTTITPSSPESAPPQPTLLHQSVLRRDTTTTSTYSTTLSTGDKTEINATPTLSSSTHSTSKTPVPSLPLTTRKTLRKSTQRLLATPFHQLTYVRNEAGDIDIDSIDNISIYPELLDNDNDETVVRPSTSRLTMISGYLPTSATATLPESIRIAKVKINRERRRMLRLRNIGNYA